jgi:hypothetical protein
LFAGPMCTTLTSSARHGCDLPVTSISLSRMAVPPFVLSHQAVSSLHTPEEDNGDESYSH